MSFRLVQNDCIQFLNEYSGEKFDMIFADPPYRLSNGGITCKNGKMDSVNKGEWDCSYGFKENYEFDKNWIKLCLENLKENGTMWISGTYHNIHIIGFIIQELGAYIINEITWYKPNAAPNISCRAFTASHETLLWIKKSKNKKHIFNYKIMKKLNNEKQMRNVWNIPTTPKREKYFTNHPTQKPIELLYRCIISSTKENDLVFDPFCGSATTGEVCIKNNRRFIGVEKEKGYIMEAQERLEYAEFKAKPFVKWAGGKSQLINVLFDKLPDMEQIDTYVEPFIGGGAMFLEMCQKYNFENIIINDMNEALINTYKVIKNDLTELLKFLDKYMEEYNLLKNMEEKKEYYLHKREEYNEENRMTIKGASLFIFLNKSCFNGLYRENSKGGFNVPSGQKEKINLYERKNLEKISEILNSKNSLGKKRVKILMGDYSKIKKYINENTLVYMDPPYRPITKSGFNQYHKSGFGDEEQKELAKFCEKLNERNTKFILSNSDPRNQIDADNPNFFDDLYENFHIDRVYAKRNINSKSTGRGNITEIVVKNF